MKRTGLTSSRTLRLSKSWSAICKRSCEYATPKISSSDFSYTGILFNFVATTLACRSSSVASAGRATMSGRGVITSRERFRAFQEYAHRPDEPHRPANQRQEGKQPAPLRAVQQHVRNKVHGDDDFEHQKHAELNER